MVGIGKKLQKKSQRPTPDGVDTPRKFFYRLKKTSRGAAIQTEESGWPVLPLQWRTVPESGSW